MHHTLLLASKSLLALTVLTLTTSAVFAQEGFRREGGSTRAQKDALEGKTAPALKVSGWVHHDSLIAKGAPTLAALKGKVVLLKFWGVW